MRPLRTRLQEITVDEKIRHRRAILFGVAWPPADGPWSITFEWDEGEALQVDLEQYH